MVRRGSIVKGVKGTYFVVTGKKATVHHFKSLRAAKKYAGGKK